MRTDWVDVTRSLVTGRVGPPRRVAYTPVVHCGSVRQAARVVCVQELPPPRPGGGAGCVVDGCDLACAVTAAAALLGAAPEAAARASSLSARCQAASPGGDPDQGPGSHAPRAAAAGAASTAVSIPCAPAGGRALDPASTGTPASGAPWAPGRGEPAGGEGGGDLGCVARVVFEFCHRPEWLQAGARLVVRDRADGCTAGAGVVRALA